MRLPVELLKYWDISRTLILNVLKTNLLYEMKNQISMHSAYSYGNSQVVNLHLNSLRVIKCFFESKTVNAKKKLRGHLQNTLNSTLNAGTKNLKKDQQLKQFWKH